MEPGTPASWQVDPTGRHEHRYWDGERWSDTVSDGGSTSVDPYAPVAAEPAPTTAAAPTAAPPVVAGPAAPTAAPPPSPAPAPDPAAPTAGPHLVSTVVAAGLAVAAIIVVILIVTNL